MFFLDLVRLDIKSHKQLGLLLICETSDEKEARIKVKIKREFFSIKSIIDR